MIPNQLTLAPNTHSPPKFPVPDKLDLPSWPGCHSSPPLVTTSSSSSSSRTIRTQPVNSSLRAFALHRRVPGSRTPPFVIVAVHRLLAPSYNIAGTAARARSSNRSRADKRRRFGSSSIRGRSSTLWVGVNVGMCSFGQVDIVSRLEFLWWLAGRTWETYVYLVGIVPIISHMPVSI